MTHTLQRAGEDIEGILLDHVLRSLYLDESQENPFPFSDAYSFASIGFLGLYKRFPQANEGWVVLRTALVALHRYLEPCADGTGLLYHLGPHMPFHEFILEQLQILENITVVNCSDNRAFSLFKRLRGGRHTVVLCHHEQTIHCLWHILQLPALRRLIPALHEIALEASPIETEMEEEEA